MILNRSIGIFSIFDRLLSKKKISYNTYLLIGFTPLIIATIIVLPELKNFNYSDLVWGGVLGIISILISKKFNSLDNCGHPNNLRKVFQYTIITLIGAFFEEMTFRAFLWNTVFKANENILITLLITTIAFVFMHLLFQEVSIIYFFSLLCRSILNSIPLIFNASIWAPIVIHILDTAGMAVLDLYDYFQLKGK